MGKILLVTSHPLTDADATSLVAEFGGSGTEYLVVVPARLHDVSSPTLLSAHQTPTEEGRAGVEAEAIAGGASEALHAHGAAASGKSIADHDLAATISSEAVDADVDVVAVMTGHSAGVGHLLQADLTSRIERHLKQAGSAITTVREHRHH